MLYIPQNNLHDCAFACLKMLLANLNKDRNFLYMPSCYGDDHCFTFLEIINIAKEYGLSLSGVKYTDKNELKKCRNTPILASINSEDKNHLVYIYKISKFFIHYYDPCFGKIVMSFKKFISQFSGYALMINSYHRSSYNSVFPLLIHIKEKILMTILQIFSAVFCLFGLYFINENFPYYLCIISFVLFAVCEIVLRKFNLVVMSRMDERFSSKFENIKEDKIYDYFKLTTEMKKEAITNCLGIVFASLVTIFITFLFVYSNFYNLILVGVSLLCSIFSYYVLKPIMKKEENKILFEEENIKIVKSFEDYKKLSKSINNRGNKYGMMVVREKYLRIFTCIISSILVMLLSKNNDPSYAILLTIISYYLSTQFDYILSYIKTVNTHELHKAQLTNLIKDR